MIKLRNGQNDGLFDNILVKGNKKLRVVNKRPFSRKKTLRQNDKKKIDFFFLPFLGIPLSLPNEKTWAMHIASADVCAWKK